MVTTQNIQNGWPLATTNFEMVIISLHKNGILTIELLDDICSRCKDAYLDRSYNETEMQRNEQGQSAYDICLSLVNLNAPNEKSFEQIAKERWGWFPEE